MRADEWRELRELRLRALAGAPDAFGSTLAEASAYPDEEWRARARRQAEGDEIAFFVALEDGRWRGMAGGWADDPGPGDVTIISMWVDPELRRRGAGRALIEAVADWARGLGASRLALWVTESNAAARALYERAGFRHTEARQALRSNPALPQVMMVRDL